MSASECHACCYARGMCCEGCGVCKKWPFLLSVEETTDFRPSWLSSGQCVLVPRGRRPSCPRKCKGKGRFSLRVCNSSFPATSPSPASRRRRLTFLTSACGSLGSHFRRTALGGLAVGREQRGPGSTLLCHLRRVTLLPSLHPWHTDECPPQCSRVL